MIERRRSLVILVRVWTGGVDDETVKKRMRRGYLIAKKLQSEGKKRIYLEEVEKIAPSHLPNGIEVIESSEAEESG